MHLILQWMKRVHPVKETFLSERAEYWLKLQNMNIFHLVGVFLKMANLNESEKVLGSGETRVQFFGPAWYLEDLKFGPEPSEGVWTCRPTTEQNFSGFSWFKKETTKTEETSSNRSTDLNIIKLFEVTRCTVSQLELVLVPE